MKETPKNKSGRRIPPVLLIWLALFVIIIPIEAVREFVSSEADSLRIFLHAAIGASLYFPVLGVWWLARRVIRGCSWRRVFISLAAFVLVIAIGYGEEDWRGKHAWNQCKRELEAQGEVLDWDKYIPPPVPDDQNFFKAPKMAEWFVGRNTTNDLYLRLNDKKFAKISSSVGANNLISSAALAQEYLAWSDQFKSDFDLIREALKRPYARMDGDYSRPFKQPIPNFVAERQLAQMLAQRTHSYLLLNQPENALRELTLLNDSRRLLESAPTGKPMTMVAAMINVAVTGLYVSAIADGQQSHIWQEPEWVALQAQLKEINLPHFVAESFRGEVAGSSHTLELMTTSSELKKMLSNQEKHRFWQRLLNPDFLILNLAPRGWYYQNMRVAATLIHKGNDGFDFSNNLILPKKSEHALVEIEEVMQHFSPWNRWARMAVPNFTKATSITAKNQTLVNEAQIVCALERYRLAHDEYPGTLDALVPRFIDPLPHDIIGGEPLHYQRTADGKFLLYSVGWNETDDDGEIVRDKDGKVDLTQGDWVWKYPTQ
jgi:hypothetical protein